DDLHAEHEGEDAAERPPIIEVAGGGINDEGGIDELADRQPPFHPSHECALRLVGRMSAHDRTLQDEVGSRQPIRILVSERNSYGGSAGLSGAGPCRMRPEVS